MSFFVNNTELKSVYYNSQKISEVYFNNVRVWKESYPWVGWANANWSDIYNLCKAKQNGDIEAWPADVVLGATKTTTLSSAVAGSTSYEMMIIGIDIDGPGVLTFQSKTVSSSNIQYKKMGWDKADCVARTTSESFYANCNAKAYIKPLVKNTFITYANDDITLNMAKTTDYVWILSDHEMNILDFGSNENTGVGVKPQFTEGVNVPYPYFTDNASRGKKNSYGSSAAYWTRTCSHHKSKFGYQVIINASGTYDFASISSGSSGFVPAFAIG
jgi:hypothetical protein